MANKKLNYNLPGFQLELQGLRGLAVSLVVLAHLGLGILPGGYIGVDVFFVLSGYLITGILFAEINYSGRIQLSDFYIKRLKRLFPALAMMISVSTIAAMLLLTSHEQEAQLASSHYALSWTSNLYFMFRSVDYFDELSSQDLFLHTWSLGVEEQFYLLFPIVLLSLFHLAKKIKRVSPSKGVCYGLLVMIVLSAALAFYWSYIDLIIAFYSMPTRLWQLLIGALVYFLILHSEQVSIFVSKMMLMAGLMSIIFCAGLYQSDMVYPGFLAFIPTFSAALVIYSGHVNSICKSKLLTLPPLTWLGDRSYSLYLWHWPVLMLGFSLGYKEQVNAALVMVGISIGLAIISYRLIEFPFWKGRYQHIEPKKFIAICLLIVSSYFIIMALLGLPKSSDQIEQTPSTLHYQFDMPVIYQMGCDTWYKEDVVRPCQFGSDLAPKTLVLLADSIGAQWFSAIVTLFPAPEWKTIVLTKSACPMVDEPFFYDRIGAIYTVCKQWRDSAIDWIRSIRPDVIFIGSSAYNFDEQQWIKGTQRILERLYVNAEHVVLIPGTPNLGFDGPGCIARSPFAERDLMSGELPCSSTQHVKKATEVAAYLDQAVKKFDNAYLLDLNDLVCPDQVCSAYSSKGAVVYRDYGHLTDTYVRSLSPDIHEKLVQLSVLDK